MKVLVIGDTIIDSDIYVNVIGTSLETPTLKTQYLNEEVKLGGAAAVGKHLAHLGAEVDMLTACNEQYAALFESANIGLINVDNKFSCIKSRIWVQKADQKYKYLQINKDVELTRNFSVETSNYYDCLHIIKEKNYQKIIISDYRRGIVTDDVINQVKQSGIMAIGAAQQSDMEPVLDRLLGLDLIVCNEEEAKSISLEGQNVCVTMGAQGCKFGGKLYASEPLQILNSVGAGDAFLSALAFSGDAEFANSYAKNYLLQLNNESETVDKR